MLRLAAIESRRAAEEAELTRRAADLESQQQELSEANTKLQRELAQLEQQRKELGTSQEQAQRIAELEAALAERDREFDQVKKELDDCRAELETRSAEFHEQEAALQEQSAQLNEQCATLENQRANLLEQVEQLSSQVEAAETLEDQSRAQLDRIANLEGELAQRSGEWATRENDLVRSIERLEAELEVIAQQVATAAPPLVEQDIEDAYDAEPIDDGEQAYEDYDVVDQANEDLDHDVACQQESSELELVRDNDNAAPEHQDVEPSLAESADVQDAVEDGVATDVGPDDEALDDLGMEHEAAAEYVPTDDDREDFVSADEALDDLGMEQEAAAEYVPTDDDREDFVSADEALDDLGMEQEAAAEYVPTDDDREDFVSADEALDNLGMEQEAAAEYGPLEEALDDQQPTVEADYDQPPADDAEAAEFEGHQDAASGLADAILAELAEESHPAPPREHHAADEPTHDQDTPAEQLATNFDFAGDDGEVAIDDTPTNSSEATFAAEPHDEIRSTDAPTTLGDAAAELEADPAITASPQDSFEETAGDAQTDDRPEWAVADAASEMAKWASAEQPVDDAFPNDPQNEGSTDGSELDQDAAAIEPSNEMAAAPADGQFESPVPDVGSAADEWGDDELADDDDPFSIALAQIVVGEGDFNHEPQADGAAADGSEEGPEATGAANDDVRELNNDFESVSDKNALGPAELGGGELRDELNSVEELVTPAEPAAEVQPAATPDESELFERIRSLVDSGSAAPAEPAADDRSAVAASADMDSVLDEWSTGADFGDEAKAVDAVDEFDTVDDQNADSDGAIAGPASAAEVLAQMGHHMEDFQEPTEAPEEPSKGQANACEPSQGLANEKLGGSTMLSASKGNEDDSIEDYMQRLLQRVGDPEQATDASTKREESSTAIMDDRDIPTSPSPRSLTKTSSMFSTSSRNRERPKTVVDIEAMRELANESTRSALSRHEKKSNDRQVLSTLATAIMALLAGASLLTLSGGRMSSFFMGGVVALVVAAYFAYRAFKAGATNVLLKVTGGNRFKSHTNKKTKKTKTKKTKNKKTKQKKTKHKVASAGAADTLDEPQVPSEWAKNAELEEAAQESPCYQPEEDQDGELLIRPEFQQGTEIDAGAGEQASFVGYEDSAQQALDERTE